MSGRKKTIRAMAAVAMLLAMLLTASCGAGSGSRQPDAASTPDRQAATAGTDVGGTDVGGAEETGTSAGRTGAGSAGEGAADLTITTLDGAEFSPAEKRGEVVALYFMAGWCGSCIPEAQVWSKLYPAYKDRGLNALMVSADPNDTPQTIAAFKRAGGIGNLPWAVDETGEFTRSLDVRALDTTIIIDREGKIAYRDAAPTPAGTLDKELKELL